jgi:hypothetical protein
MHRYVQNTILDLTVFLSILVRDGVCTWIISRGIVQSSIVAVQYIGLMQCEAVRIELTLWAA